MYMYLWLLNSITSTHMYMYMYLWLLNSIINLQVHTCTCIYGSSIALSIYKYTHVHVHVFMAPSIVLSIYEYTHVHVQATLISFFHCLRCLSIFLTFFLSTSPITSCICLGLVLVSLVVSLSWPTPNPSVKLACSYRRMRCLIRTLPAGLPW